MDANDYVPYLVFDPALSRGYEVLLFRREPEKPKKFDLIEFLSLLDDMSVGEEDVENEGQDEPAGEPSMDDLHRLTEWPQSQWTLPVFSSATGEWQERSFVREGEAVKTMASMQLDAVQPMEWGPRWRYSVYWRGALYVHCRGAFVARISLSDGKYRVFNTPIDFEESKHACPYLGKSEKGVYFVTIHKYNNLLRVWNLSESSGPIDWVLKHTIELDESTLWAATRFYQHEINGPWILEDNNNDDVENKMVPLKEDIEWNSDEIMHSSMVISMKNYVSNNPLLKATSILTECIGFTKSFMGSRKLLELGKIPQSRLKKCFMENWEDIKTPMPTHGHLDSQDNDKPFNKKCVHGG
ncbi:unnamed protein product [Triticum turgidum subsp. durum]|uniref:F-box associated domain-containing protein n=2 Tax=Triticum TaxID=4564 RepID=A0A9R0VXH9_TRITD|nr:unnamed protein product [Triticum turgidum subsp. durum]